MVHLIDNNQPNNTAGTSQYKSVTGAHFSMTSQAGKVNSSFSGDQVNFSDFKIEENTTYNNIGSIQSVAEAAYGILRNYVLDVFEKQGMDFTLSIGDDEIDLRELTQGDAQALISEDGYFGVAQTSDRIVDFAIGISGNDPSRLEAILEGIERGFNEALEAFGGWLPEISHTTYNTVLEKLDNWVKETETG